MLPPIKRVAVLGAGGLGATYASQFYTVDPASVTLIASGERYQRLKRDGVFINGQHFSMPVTAPTEAGEPVDFIIVAVKHHHLAEALEDLPPFVGPNTTILSVLNGLDSEQIIGERVGSDKLLYCISMELPAQRQGNRITFPSYGRLIFGEADNTTLSDKVRRVQAALDWAGIRHQTPPDMQRMLWWKFMINVGINQTSAVLRAGYGVFQTSPDALALMDAAMREVIAVAQAAHVNLTERDIDAWKEVLFRLDPGDKTSMLQDIEAGRQTEVEIFGGKMVKLGLRYNIPTPVNHTLLQIIRVIEQQQCAEASP